MAPPTRRRAEGRSAVALACTGLGRVERGFESYTGELFATLKDRADVTLFKGGGPPGPREVVVPNVPRQASLRFGLTRDWRQAYRWEQLSFALGMTPHLLGGRFDLVHYMDGALAAGLLRVRRALGLRFALLFKNGGAHTPDTYARVDYIQLVTPDQHREALAFGLPPERLFMIPLGVDGGRFAPRPDADRGALRARYAVPPGAWVVLSAAALNASEKRLDWVIRETAALGDPDVFLLMAGQRGPETPSLERLARDLLPGRHAFTTVPFERMPDVYWLADAFALGSVREGFGLAVVEAASAGVPVLVHDSEHFRWITFHPASRVDMTAAGALAAALRMLRASPDVARAMSEANRRGALERFAWDRLAPQYVSMYETVSRRAGHA